jgi:serine/threonine-protein kinase
MLPPETCLGPYRIVSLISSGESTQVYRAVDTRLDRQVTLKILSEPFTHDPDAILRFEREAKTIAALSHPNILAVHDFNTHQNLYMVVTELLEGETLRTRLQRSTLSWQQAAQIGSAVASALAAAHAKGIVHRDLKPENIFLTSGAQAQVKVLDFGIAEMNLPSKAGSFDYRSPEQILGETGDARSDIFSLGCILYEMITGKPDAPAMTEDNPEPFASTETIPFELQSLIRHCLQKDPDCRLQSAHDLSFNLRELLSSSAAMQITSAAPVTSYQRLLPVVVTILLAGFVFSLYFLMGRNPSMQSIAVLPFDNSAGDSETEYLSDGIPESLINALSQVRQLRVMARSTAFRFKGKTVNPREVGRELKVEAVITGTILARGANLRVKTELTKVSNGAVLWEQDYAVHVSEILPVQQEISANIIQTLRIRLTGEEQRLLAKPYTQSKEAFRLYLKGRYHWNKRTPEGLKRGIEFFEQAIQKDPGYALAYAGLADSYTLLANYGALPPKEAFQKAQGAALKALDIDEELAEAHTSLAHIFVRQWEWSKAEKEFRRAIQLKPGYSTAHHWYANYLLISGKLNEAISEITRAAELDPLSLIINEAVALHLYVARRYDEAIGQLQKTMQLDPNFTLARATLGEVYVGKKMYPEAILEFQKAIELSAGVTDYTAELGHVYAVSGRKEQALSVLNQLLQEQNRKYVSPSYIALIYAGLGSNEQAFEWLQKAYDQRSESIVFLKCEPRFDGIRKDSRYGKLLRLIGLPP